MAKKKWQKLAEEYRGLADEIKALRKRDAELAHRIRDLIHARERLSYDDRMRARQLSDEIRALAQEQADANDRRELLESDLEEILDDAYSMCPFDGVILQGIARFYEAVGLS